MKQNVWKQPKTILLIAIVAWIITSQIVKLFAGDIYDKLLFWVLVILMIAFLVANFYMPYDRQ